MGQGSEELGTPVPFAGERGESPSVPANAFCPQCQCRLSPPAWGAAGDSPIPAASRVPGGCGRRRAAGSGAGLAASLSSLPALPALPCPSLPSLPPLRALFLCAPPVPSPPLRRQPPLRGPAPLPAGGGATGGGRRGTPLLGAAPALPHGGDPPQPHRAGAAPRGLPAAARAPGRPGELPWRRDAGLGAARRRLGPPPAPTAGSWGWGWRGGCSWRSRGADPLGTGSPRKGCGWRWGHLAAPRPRTTARG